MGARRRTCMKLAIESTIFGESGFLETMPAAGARVLAPPNMGFGAGS